MRLFACDSCGSVVYFDNRQCLNCGSRLGFSPERMAMAALPGTGDRAEMSDLAAGRWRLCANALHDACNWLVPAGTADRYCRACRHDRTIPNLSDERNRVAFRKILAAQAHLFYSLLRLRLAVPTLAEEPNRGLAFDFLASPPPRATAAPPVMTGYGSGIITLAVDEADDAERETRRSALSEPYRTLLGHFRHESGHYYWERLVRDGGETNAFRALLGDERADYQAALAAHYGNGPPAGWQARHVSAYAAAHPWEDFAETWAHYLHIVDTLETAHAFGLSVAPRLAGGDELTATVSRSPYDVPTIGELLDAWVPLTIAINTLNRSMGQPDLYPFVLSDVAAAKLGFIHRLVRDPQAGRRADR